MSILFENVWIYLKKICIVFNFCGKNSFISCFTK